MSTTQALVSSATRLELAADPSPRVHPFAVGAIALGGLTCGFFVIGMPVGAFIALAGLATLALAAHLDARLARASEGEIKSPTLRAGVTALEQATAEVARVAAASQLGAVADTTVARCDRLVKVARTFAVSANSLYAFLERTRLDEIRLRIAGLQHQAEDADDEMAIVLLGNAAAASLDQLERVRRLGRTHDRMAASLELARASVLSCAAAIVELDHQERSLESAATLAASFGEIVDELDALSATLAAPAA